MLSCLRSASPNQVFSCSPAGGVWLAASYSRVFLLVPNPFYLWESVLEKTSHANYSDLFLGRNVPKSQKQKSQKQYEAWYWWTIKSEFHLLILLCSWIHHPFQLWALNPSSISWPVGIIAILQMENGRCIWPSQIAPKPGNLARTGSQLPWLLSSPLTVWQHSLEERARG